METSLTVKRGGRRDTIWIKDIVFMEKERRKIIINMREGEISFYGRYHEIEGGLDERFTSPHRSYMINMDYVTMLNGSQIIMRTGHVINLCRTCMGRFKKTYDSYCLKKLQ